MSDKTLASLTAASPATGGLLYGTQGGADRKFTLSAAGAALIEATTPPGGIKALITSDYVILNPDQCRNGIIYAPANAGINLPAIEDGMSLTIIAVGAIYISLTPNGSDQILTDGVTAGTGGSITNNGLNGDKATLTYHSEGTWYASTNGWFPIV